MLPYLNSDQWHPGDPSDAWTGSAFWVSIRRVRDSQDFVELLTWHGPSGRWGSPYDTDTIHFKIVRYMRADVPQPYPF
jgi:hypothetical protein